MNTEEEGEIHYLSSSLKYEFQLIGMNLIVYTYALRRCTLKSLITDLEVLP